MPVRQKTAEQKAAQKKRLQDALNARLEKIREPKPDPANPGYYVYGDMNTAEAKHLKSLYNRVNKYGMSDKEKKRYDKYIKDADREYADRNVRSKGKKNLHQMENQNYDLRGRIKKKAQSEYIDDYLGYDNDKRVRNVDDIYERYEDNAHANSKVLREAADIENSVYRTRERNFNDPLVEAARKRKWYHKVSQRQYMNAKVSG